MLRLLDKAPWAVADQLLISAANFATMVLLARGLSQEDFGSFTLLYLVLLFANSLQSGLITQPHNILGVTRHGGDYICYTTSTAVSQLFLGAVAALAVLAAWAVARYAAWRVAPLLLTLAPSIVFWQLQEFVRRILYTERRLAAAFVNDSISYGGQALAIAALWWLDGLTAPLALSALAATSAIAAALGGWQIRGSLAGRIDPSVCAENWHFGKWLVANEVVGTWLLTYLFVYLGAAMLGRAVAAILQAVQTIFGPARVLAYAINTVLPIHFARSQAAGGRAALHAQLKAASLLAVPLLGGYCLLVAIFAEPLMRLVYGEKYAGTASLVALYATCTCLWYVTMIITAALWVRRLARLMFMNRLCVGLIAIPVGYYLILTLGIHGIVLSMIATSLATYLLSWRVYRQDLAGGSSPGCRPTRRNLASQPTVPLAGIPLASGEETEQLLRWSRGPVLRAGEAATVLDLIRQHVARSPEAAALVCDRATLTYAALNQQALGLARQLQSRGAGPGTFVGILLERSSDWLWALVGVLESGAAYLPLDPATPPGRLGEILRDARPAIVVTSRALADRLAAHMELVCLTEDVKPVTGGTGIPPDPDSPAYLIYTSGSTGRPKGVVATHRNLLGSTLARLQYYPEPVRRFLLLSPFTFDSSVAGVFWTLAQGGTLVLPKASASDVTAVVEDIERLGVSHTLCIPSLYRLILDRAAGGELLSLRAVIVAGESCPESLPRRHSEKAPWCRLYNEYGPTEATVWCTVYECPASGGRAGPQGVSIGRPIPGAEVFVLDGDRKPVPVGVPGEIYVGGVGVTRGYWDRPELTAQAFLAHPFSPGARVYRTGDLGCFLPSGDIEYLGRKDGQVKVRGFRIELGEIEHALARHPAVEEAAVVKVPGRESLTAFVAPKDPAAAASLEDELRRFLREALPAPLVPSSFVALPALPRTAHGKIDRSALPALERSCHDVGLTVIEPSSDCERRLRSVWEEVLGVTPIGVEDDFIKLGGDSLIATVLLVRIEKEFGKSISPSILLRGGSIRQLARLLAGEAPPRQESLTVQLREGSGRPLFILPGIGGLIEELIHLTSHLNTGRPIYSFRSPGQDGVSEPIDGIELLAMHYLESLRSVQPEGPYLFVGYSFGGTIAFEMALQLHAAGERVDYLAILDQDAPREFFRLWLNPAYTAPVAYKFVRWAMAGFFRSTGRKEHAATIALCVSSFFRVWKVNLSLLLGLLTRGSIISSEITQAAALPTPLSRLIAVNLRAEMRYRPRIYPGRVLLYRVRSEPPCFRLTRLDMGWGRFVQQDVDVRFLEGKHLTFHKEPGARLLAKRIEADLAMIESLCVDHASSAIARGRADMPLVCGLSRQG